MDQITFQSWALDAFETPPGSIDFPIEVHDIALRFEARYTGLPKVFESVLDPSGRALFRRPFALVPGKGAVTAKGESKFGLRIDRPGRYAVVAEFNGQRIAETFFRIRQYPSIARDDG